MMLRGLLFICLVGLYIPVFCSEVVSSLKEELQGEGFENVNVRIEDKLVLVALENNIFQWDIDGIAKALDIVGKQADENCNVKLYLLKHGVPRVQIFVPVAMWTKVRAGEMSAEALEEALRVQSNVDDAYHLLNEEELENLNINKIDFVIYPQVSLQNRTFSQVYETQLNIAPAMEVDLWKGMQFTGQIIFPIHNDLGLTGDDIRAGFVTIAQEFYLGKSSWGRITAGNFNASRYGVDASWYKTVLNDKVELEANIGVTGSSEFYDNRWWRSDLNTITWFVKSRYFHDEYNLQGDLTCGRFIDGDCGVRADLTRHFGGLSVGGFAMVSGGRFNGGFHFEVPLFFKKRNRRKSVRIVPARYFDWEYNAGTEFVKGQFYETRPNANRTENNFNPIYIKSQLINSL